MLCHIDYDTRDLPMSPAVGRVGSQVLSEESPVLWTQITYPSPPKSDRFLVSL